MRRARFTRKLQPTCCPPHFGICFAFRGGFAVGDELSRILYMSAMAHSILNVDEESRERAKSIDIRYESIKPFLDFPLAALMLLVTAPIILVAMLLVKLTSRGRAIYTQQRLGQGGRTITIYKIRTMYQDSERDTGPVWSLPGDPRVTPVGRFLRGAHLDELPQLVNILRGEMSLVGPRPERPELVAQIERALPRYRQRLTVRPGLTGLAQVRQDPDIDLFTVRRKLNFDLYYVERMSFWLDLRVLLGTVLKCSGVRFDTIGRILQFPDERIHFVGESPSSGQELPAASYVLPSFLASNEVEYEPASHRVESICLE
jgi:lipopolysaccharide/colanic/teichoic acid biosynthesis glycosyltransferase